MITVSPKAAEQIKLSAEQNQSQGMCLRVAARVTTDEGIDYGMGFDDEKEGDLKNTSEGVEIIVAPNSAELLHGMHIDFVQLEDGTSNFIFLNPNDPNFKPPKDK